MQASELIVEVLEREADRLLTWADQHVRDSIGRPAVAAALVRGWRAASTSWRTPDGPVALLLSTTETAIQGRPALIGTYLSPTARQTCTVPTLGELHQACQAYAWIGMAAAHMRLSFTRSSMVVAALNAEGQVDRHERAIQGGLYQPCQGRVVFRRLLDVAEYLVKSDGEEAGDAAAVARRELERSRRWLATLPARAG